MPQVLWSLYFVQAQGYDVTHAEVMQDNLSTQLLAKNGKFSSSKKTKHIKAKFFFVTDKVKSGELKIVDCPTDRMWADVLTKPLQGRAFREMRAVLMGCPVDYDDEVAGREKRVRFESDVADRSKPAKMIAPPRATPTASSQECVGVGRGAKKATGATRGVPRGTQRRTGATRGMQGNRAKVARRGFRGEAKLGRSKSHGLTL